VQTYTWCKFLDCCRERFEVPCVVNRTSSFLYYGEWRIHVSEHSWTNYVPFYWYIRLILFYTSMKSSLASTNSGPFLHKHGLCTIVLLQLMTSKLLFVYELLSLQYVHPNGRIAWNLGHAKGKTNCRQSQAFVLWLYKSCIINIILVFCDPFWVQM